ncbi:hypothetical protein TorRG33x02_226610 [Trema orientale]|uniref:Uncharacterized protein n=1 Tax=Trema orientale TaxID=63057 RepID=A0A2P5E7N4_TREOI|nr:hypothetical protein TorRG33x02_226610 [Trema orientale]
MKSEDRRQMSGNRCGIQKAHSIVDAQCLTKFFLHAAPKHVEVEFANVSALKLSADFLRILKV